jgi:hypothetical protein
MRHPVPQPPKYWTFEPPELGPAVHAYTAGEDLTVRDVALMREYLRQWVDSSVWEMNPHETDEGLQWLAELRQRVRAIASPDDITQALSIMTARRMDWTFEPSELSVAVHAYMAGEDLTVRDVALMRAYLKQWVDSPVWGDEGLQWLAELRQRVRAIASPDDITQALSIMTAYRMDPLQFPSDQTSRRAHVAASGAT